MFELYIIILICFLLPVCYFITNNLKYIYKQANILNNIKKLENKIYIEYKDIIYIINTYIKRKKWLHCIAMLEFYLNQSSISENKILANYYNYIGLCYQLIDMYKIAKKYYLKAYNKQPNNKEILKNLNNI
uniref:Uncharacterized protein n=1 Tax=Hydropuntia rangiferina TaxID=338881 RepID=A0A345U867_9FLOR|nr:hypothetical protein [Hydropuntia rangiferina]AXI96653.1 hypothetical protein [Hydropuntia rangiferina]UAD87336.1 hypothetical protein [Hydropuntia rangiferina]